MLPSGTAIVLVGLKTTDAGRGYGRAAGSAKRSTAPRLQRLTTERQDAPSSGNAEIVSQLSLRRSVGVTFGLEGSMDAFRILDEGELSIHPLPGLGDLVCGLGRSFPRALKHLLRSLEPILEQVLDGAAEQHFSPASDRPFRAPSRRPE